jgi:hypothetical protein
MRAIAGLPPSPLVFLRQRRRFPSHFLWGQVCRRVRRPHILKSNEGRLMENHETARRARGRTA